MSVNGVNFTVAAHIMAALGYYHSEEVSSAILANSAKADPTFVRKSLRKSPVRREWAARAGYGGQAMACRAHLPGSEFCGSQPTA
jgi:hypothetical protein